MPTKNTTKVFFVLTLGLLTAVLLAAPLRGWAMDSGYHSPAAQAIGPGGDGNGYEVSPGNSFADDGAFAADMLSGTAATITCTATTRDKHDFFNYGFAIPAGSSINGIEVRLDAKVDTASNEKPALCVQLSRDGGLSWTAAKSTPILATSETTYLLGGATDTWGNTWTNTNLSDANFRVRVVDVAYSAYRHFYLDWVAVKIYYGSGATATSTSVLPTSTPMQTNTPGPTATSVAPTNTPTLGPTNTPSGSPVLLSRYRPAYSSSIEMAGFEAAYAVDGHPVTRWGSQYSDPQWIYIDLQGTATISRVVLSWEAAYGKAYEIQVSNDAVSWTPIYTKTNSRGGVEDLTVSGTGRYVRMYGTQRGLTDYGYSLYEFEVYGTGGGPLISPTATPLPTSTPTPGPSPTPGPYVLVWNDEFDGTSIDTSKWSYELGYLRNEEDQWYQPDNASVANGVLTIEARREATGHQCGSALCQYTSSSLYTRGKGDFLYGKIEARLKLPMAPGTWPAFWTLGSNINMVIYPNCGEIDIMEHINSETLTYGGIWYGTGPKGREKESASSIAVADPDNWHVYSVEWNAQEIKWFVDGVQFHQADITLADREEFHASQYLILNLAVGGAWPQDPSGTTFPQKMYADWVRVYQKP